jgi:hypothetical protein
MKVDIRDVLDVILEYHAMQVRSMVEFGEGEARTKAAAARELADLMMGDLLDAEDEDAIRAQLEVKGVSFYKTMFFHLTKEEHDGGR